MFDLPRSQKLIVDDTAWDDAAIDVDVHDLVGEDEVEDERTVRVAPNAIDRYLHAKRYMMDALKQVSAADSDIAALQGRRIEAAESIEIAREARETESSVRRLCP